MDHFEQLLFPLSKPLRSPPLSGSSLKLTFYFRLIDIAFLISKKERRASSSSAHLETSAVSGLCHEFKKSGLSV